MAGRMALHVALVIEACWEMIENTPMVIDRYRATTAALGYAGDSVLNSLSDILMMALGFLLARKLRSGPRSRSSSRWN